MGRMNLGDEDYVDSLFACVRARRLSCSHPTYTHQGVFEGKVLVGAYRRGTTEGGAQWRAVKSSMQVHPQNDHNSLANDVMLFKIAPTTWTPV